jgi:hypothetical protein
MIVRPDITGLHSRELIWTYILQVAQGETQSVFKKALVELSLGWHPLWTWVFVADITYEFILELDVLLPTMHLWIWGTVCCDWPRKTCHYGAPGHNDMHHPM